MTRILVITSCTGEKAVTHDKALTFDDFSRGGAHLAERRSELANFKRLAVDLYTGQQHVRLMRGVKAIENGRKKDTIVDLWILSAGYGLVSSCEELVPYECTFQGMKAADLREWAKQLNVPRAFRESVSGEFDLGLILLSDDYLKACDLDETIEFGGPTLLFCGAGTAKRLPQCKNLRTVVASTSETKRFGAGLVALKGELGGRVLEYLADEQHEVSEFTCPKANILNLLDAKPRTKTRSQATKAQRRRFERFRPRVSARLLYFIPEWDDRVDPDYDFFVDGITEGREPYTHDVYAHEIYSKPNYDGILVSKSVIEENQKKKQRIAEVGIHAHVRVPREFPIMGDCGAFNYIGECEPPYGTEETVRFYQTLDFDFGVSIDHLIVPEHLERTVYQHVGVDGTIRHITRAQFDEFKSQGLSVCSSKGRARKLFADEPELIKSTQKDLSEAKRRWNLTLQNSEDFLKEHDRQQATFVPIAGCQGWDIESQTEMFRLQQEMGYEYIALGGLVRSPTKYILELLDSVNRIRRPMTRIHLFGVARPDAIGEFVRQGVNSVDSARFLRQAWLSARSNYYTGDAVAFAEQRMNGNGLKHEEEPPRYTALRIPPIYRENSSTLLGKAKKLVDDGFDVAALERLEKATMNVVHAFDRGEADLESTLAEVVKYDKLMGGDPRNEPLYRRLLEDKPWKQCPCDVCQRTGIDVVIFRRNNRNRRRGFHNTWWFFQFFQHMTAENGQHE